jgi:hypothetical protein
MALTKARITIESSGKSFDVLFNPEEYSVNKDNNFASQAVPGLSSPLIQFVNGNLRTLEMELFFDTTDARTDVRDQTSKVTDLLKIDSNLHAPPIIVVSWASLQFRCVLTRANQKFIRFIDDGTPVRARLTCSFSEFIDVDREAKEVNRQTADFTKHHIVKQEETLSQIATSFYGNPMIWRPIAIANSIDDPRSITAGQTLLIPSLPYVDQETGEVVQ